ncbi:MAG TPA: DUF1446 domain-containing protein [Ilumatobacteraceae bacterium]|nr:DUF1446 domain-containing protein [Ilumatobacteraceae bacterium]
MTAPDPGRAVRIANCSGFFGDRLSAASEMVNSGDIDVLTGDWLAELTMLILHKQRLHNPELGYAGTFLRQMEQVLATCIERDIKVVTNAGGLNPAGCADKVREIAARLGLDVKVAYVDGDDLMDRIEDLRPQLEHLDTGAPLTGQPVTANAYMGGWGIAAALKAGADVVVCGRVTDAAIVVGPAAWWHDWAMDDWNALAGAVVAGHVIECGTQATGGNYSWFEEIPQPALPLGYPIAEVAADGSCVITKHAGTGGIVNVGTVTAQLLYEIASPAYANPDVISRFDTVQVAQEGPDRVRISDTIGEPAPASTKVCINLDGGYRNRMSFVLTGLDQERKARWLTEALFTRVGGRDRFDEVDIRLVEAPSNAPTQEQSSGRLHITVKSSDERLAGKAFSGAAIELALANYPGFFATGGPSEAQPFGIYWPALVEAREVHQSVVLPDGSRVAIALPPSTSVVTSATRTATTDAVPVGPAAGEALGLYFAARSGDKGGNANVGIWARDAGGYAWLAENLTANAVKSLLQEAADLEVRRYELSNIHALNFVIVGLLGEGVASSTAFDTQAKGLGEYLRSRIWRR